MKLKLKSFMKILITTQYTGNNQTQILNLSTLKLNVDLSYFIFRIDLCLLELIYLIEQNISQFLISNKIQIQFLYIILILQFSNQQASFYIQF
ncbi:hypothetical protein pb186bvf_020300 [Paramecium bursaria]